MINRLVDGMSLALSSYFGDEYTIYTDKVPQNFKEPSFSVRLVTGQPEHFKNNRYRGRFHFVVRYYPKPSELTGESLIDSQSKNMLLSHVLETITDMSGRQYRGTKMRGEYSDDVLTFFVSYEMFMDKEDIAADPMEFIELNS